MTATCNRDDLAWALGAVLPHAGSGFTTDAVGMHGYNDALYVYATDKYTAGIARLPLTGQLGSVVIPTTGVRSGEAGDLEKFARPGRVAEKADDVLLQVGGQYYLYDPSYDDGELHVAIGEDSAVFWQKPSSMQHVNLWAALSATLLGYQERLEVESREYTFSPAFLGRFSKAARLPGDSLRMHPYMLPSNTGKKGGVALVTVGDNFIGAIGGMEHKQGMESVLDSWFGTSSLKEAA